jgi:hypothetical protein
MSVRRRFRLLPTVDACGSWLELEDHRDDARDRGPVELTAYREGGDSTTILLSTTEVMELQAVCQLVLGDYTAEDITGREAA